MTEMQLLERKYARRHAIEEAGRVPMCHDYYDVSDGPIVSPGSVHGRATHGLIVEIPAGQVLTALTHHGPDMDWEWVQGPAIVEFVD